MALRLLVGHHPKNNKVIFRRARQRSFFCLSIVITVIIGQITNKSISQKPVRNKNISRFLADIRHPTPKVSAISKKQKFELSDVLINRKKSGLTRFAAIFIVLILSSFGLTAWGARENTMGKALIAYRNFISTLESTKQFDIDGMKRVSKRTEANFESIDIYSRILGLIPAFREMPMFISAFSDFNKTAIAMADTTNILKKEGFTLIWENGQELLSKLESLRAQANSMIDLFIKIRNGITAFGVSVDNSKDYLALHSKMTETNNFLEGTIDMLKNGGNILILFMNNSEIRATGGLIGNYIVLKLNDGEIEEMSINDIAYPNKFLERKIVPPSPMMGAIANWEARNANWFFDFPTSVSKVLGFMEKSPAYANKGIKFDGAIAMNHKVITDILRLTGPIELPDYGMVLDHTNFFAEIQKEASRDSILRGEERKNILKSLLPRLISRMKEMSSRNQIEFVEIVKNRFNNKDIQAYFADKRLQAFISNYLWGGEVYQIKESAYEDYLAVVISNIGGEKTDAYMRQKVSLKSVIEDSGAITNTLSITRVHEGDRATEAFYRAKNQAYIRTLVPKGAKLLSVEGEMARTVRPRVNYERSGHKRDPDVELFEKGIESGKTVFGHWLTVNPGSDKELVIRYERPAAFAENFRFVYEKQSGVDSMFSYSVQAPQGYIFKESGTSVYEYHNANLPARLIIDLTLQKL